MLTILMGRKDIILSDVGGFKASVRDAFVMEDDQYVSLRDSRPFQEYEDIEIALLGRFLFWRLHLTDELKEAIKLFMRTYHAKQNLDVDCYAFANMVKGVVPHKVAQMLEYWRMKRLWADRRLVQSFSWLRDGIISGMQLSILATVSIFVCGEQEEIWRSHY